MPRFSYAARIFRIAALRKRNPSVMMQSASTARRTARTDHDGTFTCKYNVALCKSCKKAHHIRIVPHKSAVSLNDDRINRLNMPCIIAQIVHQMDHFRFERNRHIKSDHSRITQTIHH
mgnify:CR=1 FL=1